MDRAEVMKSVRQIKKTACDDFLKSPLAIPFYEKVAMLTLLRPENSQISPSHGNQHRTGNRYKSRSAKTVNMCLFNVTLSHLKRNCLGWPEEFKCPLGPSHANALHARARGRAVIL